jgi:hypothetical protein
MRKKQEQTPTAVDLATQPFFYEVRVRGRLSEDQWTAWFSNLTVSTNKGESVLRGTLPDHAALYGLLARLRDLAVPLLSVNVFDLLINLLLLVIYLTLVGGLVAITTFLTSDGILDTALALAALFAALGVLSYALSLWSGHNTWRKAWRWLTYGSWLSSVITFLIFTSVANVLPSAVAIALLLFLGAGGLIYLLSYLRGRAERVNDVIVEWESLGSRAGTPDAERKDESSWQDAPR